MHPSPTTSRRGFTIVELSIGMAVTGLVLAALMSFTLAMATAWKSNRQTEAEAMVANVAQVRVDAIVRASRSMGAWRWGSMNNSKGEPAAVLLWRNDDSGDDIVQLSEVDLLCYNPGTRTIDLYRGISPKDDRAMTKVEFESDTTIDELQQQLRRRPLCAKIDGLQILCLGGSSRRPTIEVSVRINKDGRSQQMTIVSGIRSARPGPQ